MFAWMKRGGSPHQRLGHAETAKPAGRAMTGRYLLLYKYLENRYANMVVLTFAEIEDLLGFALPDQARQNGFLISFKASSRLRPISLTR